MPSIKARRPRVLLASVFKPFAQDDEFGSRAANPIELYHNQVTREQGPFSLRMFHRSWGLMFLQENITAPCTVLDFPTREAFVRANYRFLARRAAGRRARRRSEARRPGRVPRTGPGPTISSTRSAKWRAAS